MNLCSKECEHFEKLNERIGYCEPADTDKDAPMSGIVMVGHPCQNRYLK